MLRNGESAAKKSTEVTTQSPAEGGHGNTGFEVRVSRLATGVFKGVQFLIHELFISYAIYTCIYVYTVILTTKTILKNVHSHTVHNCPQTRNNPNSIDR